MIFAKKPLKIVTRREIKSINNKKLVNVRYENIDLFLDLTKEGIKLCVKAPSAKILLKRLGNLKATKKISLYMFAPSIEAVSKSLINPKILDVSIPILLVKKDLIIMRRF
jgi:hypothetical protein